MTTATATVAICSKDRRFAAAHDIEILAPDYLLNEDTGLAMARTENGWVIFDGDQPVTTPNHLRPTLRQLGDMVDAATADENAA